MLGEFSSYRDVDLTPSLTFLGEGSVVKQGEGTKNDLEMLYCAD